MTKTDYIKIVLNKIYADKKTLQRIEEDLNERIELAMESDPFLDIVEEMGEPDELAKEFMENLDIDPDSHPYVVTGFSYNYFEYKSKRKLFGLPLVHVNTGGRFKTKTAKGIIAVGDVAIGVFSVGGVSLGVFSIGGISFGALAIGGVAIGGAAVGGVAIGLYAIGGVAISIFKAIGGFSLIL